jgi:hypothetical protein
MAPKIWQETVDQDDMTIHFRSGRRTPSLCPHESLMRIEIKGMRRNVCENCGRVITEPDPEGKGAPPAQTAGSSEGSDTART